MTIASVVCLWLACAWASWWFGEESFLNTFGNVDNKDRRFIITWSLMGGPLSLLIAVVEWLGSRRPATPRRILRTRERRT